MYSRIKSVSQWLGKTVIMAIMAVFIAGAANVQDKKEVVILQDYLYVYPEHLGDYTNSMGDYTYSKVLKMCDSINLANSYGFSDWRLPTIAELEMIQSNFSEIEGLQVGGYMSNEKCPANNGCLCGNNNCNDVYRCKNILERQRFFSRDTYYCSCKGNVRLVRTEKTE